VRVPGGVVGGWERSARAAEGGKGSLALLSGEEDGGPGSALWCEQRKDPSRADAEPCAAPADETPSGSHALLCMLIPCDAPVYVRCCDPSPID